MVEHRLAKARVAGSNPVSRSNFTHAPPFPLEPQHQFESKNRSAGDKGLIDGLVVNGSARLVGWFSSVVRTVQTGYIYHYAFVMILGVLGTLLYFFPFWHA